MKKAEYPGFPYLRRLALKAGKIIVDNFGKTEERLKPDGTPITIVDESINKLVLKSISQDFPNVSLIAEEGSREISGAEYLVLCDPLDGTIPFCLGLPVSTFCISVLKKNIPLIGIIFDPFCKRMWHAIRGKGSFLNGKKIKVSHRNQVSNSKICLTWWKGAFYNIDKAAVKLTEAGALLINPVSVAYFGGLIASGKTDAVIFPGQNGWETAAMQVIIEEAGGRVTDIYGEDMVYSPKAEIRGHIMSNGLIHDELVELVQSCQ